MQNKSDRGTVVGLTLIYAVSTISLIQIHPINPWLAGLRVGLLLLFSSVCLYALFLVKRDGLAKLAICSPAQSFSPMTIRIIGLLVSAVCGFVLAYPIISALPMITDHHSLNGWRETVKFQTTLIEKLEGKPAAERYWKRCFSHIFESAGNYEHRGNLVKALDYYSECKDLQDESDFSGTDVANAIGLICDRLNEFDIADLHYFHTGDILDEFSTGIHLISNARMLRILRFVPEEIVVEEFNWGRDIANMRDLDSCDVAQHYSIIDMTKMDDYQRELIRPIFHPQILPGKSKLTARQRASLGESWKHPYQRLTEEQYQLTKFSSRLVLKSIGVKNCNY